MALAPSVITVFALLAGLTSIRFAFEEAWELAVFAIVVAAVEWWGLREGAGSVVVAVVEGTFGIVGLVVPHLARRLVGATHRLTLPTSALLGALLLIWADAFARTAFAPRELPLGILTALIGTPLLILLVRRLTAR